MAVPPGDEGWLCPVCECKMDCVELINAEFNSKYEVENSWEVSTIMAIACVFGYIASSAEIMVL